MHNEYSKYEVSMKDAIAAISFESRMIYYFK